MVLTQVDQHPLELVAVLADRALAVLFDGCFVDMRSHIGLQNVPLNLHVRGVLACDLFVHRRELDSHVSHPFGTTSRLPAQDAGYPCGADALAANPCDLWDRPLPGLWRPATTAGIRPSAARVRSPRSRPYGPASSPCEGKV